MPTISMFYGIAIIMRFLDHNPPHFHVEYSGYKAVIDIEKIKLLNGSLPRRALNLVLDWTELHQDELRKNWELCMQNQTPMKIKPLE